MLQSLQRQCCWINVFFLFVNTGHFLLYSYVTSSHWAILWFCIRSIERYVSHIDLEFWNWLSWKWIGSVLHIVFCWLVEVLELLSLLTLRTLYSYFGISHWSEMLWFYLCSPWGILCPNVVKKNPAVTHFALIVPLPSRKECQRPVFLEFDSDILPQFLLTL